MLVRDEPIGLVTLLRSDAKGPFSDDHGRLSGILTSQSAQILAHARLVEELTTANRLLEMSQQKLQEENAKLQSELGQSFAFESIIGDSPPMRRALALASRFSANDSPVLITGDTGTGKELVARAMHFNGPRKQKPFVVKNCGVKTESLLESELFGHVKGSFTGAVRDRKGLFEEADGGTIFLDEIGDAPPPTQVAILRVLQTGEIRPVGAQKTKVVNVRVISATNKDLKKEIAAGNFREDLFYRLATFTVELPRLRERAADIPLLARHMLAQLSIKAGQPALSVSPEVMELLMAYPWPGNVRQLENELERAAVVCDLEDGILIEHLSPELRNWTPHDPDLRPYQGRLREIVERVEQDTIRSALAEHHGNILQTANNLGLTRKGLKDKMARYGIHADEVRGER
jgi:transcriptional regulator with GAF, ATPase, and Fis domain